MIKRRKFCAGNWKMNHTPRDTVAYVDAFAERISAERSYDIALFPSFVCLPFAVGNLLKRPDIWIGGQNLSDRESGAFTGEVSGAMLKDAGCSLVLVGHSERRQLFGETDEWLGKKLARAFASELYPVFCLGETLEERNANRMEAVVDRQLTALDSVPEDRRKDLTIAYEPVWAIGTGVNATPQQAQDAHAYIRSKLQERWGDTSMFVRILYGGSVTAQNAAELFACADVDGVLVGGASLKVDSFATICDFAAA